jgi:hypothetical protein
MAERMGGTHSPAKQMLINKISYKSNAGNTLGTQNQNSKFDVTHSYKNWEMSPNLLSEKV